MSGGISIAAMISVISEEIPTGAGTVRSVNVVTPGNTGRSSWATANGQTMNAKTIEELKR
jgi:hypothetical protein